MAEQVRAGEGDLVDRLVAALEQRRDEINASRVAQGEAGRVEISVNLALRSIGIAIVIEDRRRVA
jgi:hypothetical protein